MFCCKRRVKPQVVDDIDAFLAQMPREREVHRDLGPHIAAHNKLKTALGRSFHEISEAKRKGCKATNFLERWSHLVFRKFQSKRHGELTFLTRHIKDLKRE